MYVLPFILKKKDFFQYLVSRGLYVLSLVNIKKHMDKKAEFKFRMILGIIIIGATVFLSFRYLLKGPPFIKVMAIGLVAGVAYLVIDHLIKKSKENKDERF